MLVAARNDDGLCRRSTAGARVISANKSWLRPTLRAHHAKCDGRRRSTALTRRVKRRPKGLGLRTYLVGIRERTEVGHRTDEILARLQIGDAVHSPVIGLRKAPRDQSLDPVCIGET